MRALLVGAFLVTALALVAPQAEAGGSCQGDYCTTTTPGICGTLNPAQFIDEGLPEEADTVKRCVKICRRQQKSCTEILRANVKCTKRLRVQELGVRKLVCNNNDDADSESPKECKARNRANAKGDRSELRQHLGESKASCNAYGRACVESCKNSDD